MARSAGSMAADFQDFITPSQYSDLIRRRARLMDGERRLLWAVLEDAIRTYLGKMAVASEVEQREFQEVRDWFAGRNGSEGLFAFATICDFLEIDAGRLLKGLEALRQPDLPKRKCRLPIRRKLGRLAA